MPRSSIPPTPRIPPGALAPDTRDQLIAMNACPSLDRGTICRLGREPAAWIGLPRSGSAKDRAARARAAADLGIRETVLDQALRSIESATEVADRERSTAARQRGATIIALGDAEYPLSLHELALPPPVLYVRGTLPIGLALSVVGSRKMNAYGREATSLFAGDLAAAGLIVVSGFARGVDATAHRATCSRGRTIAVLGCGLDVDYPRGQRSLANEIEDSGGALVSEFPMGAIPRPWHFPIRNRVIAGLSIGTLVIQAAIRSGSLITAHHSLELGREVYAIPGSIFDPLSRGPNRLIADGAVPILQPRDVLETLSIGQQTALFPRTRERIASQVRGFAGSLLQVIPSGEALTCEEIADKLGSPVDNVLGTLLELELGGHLRREPGPRYRR